MELQYIVAVIIKILISVPTIVLITSSRAHGAALMGGHLNNNSNYTTPNYTNNSYELDLDSSQGFPTNGSHWELPESNASAHQNRHDTPAEYQDYEVEASTEEEEIPDPSALVLPGYNLPENIFNKGKPFYLEKDPLTGQVDFNSRTSLSDVDDEFEYLEDDPNSNLYDKGNINRKDGSLASHKASDVNQLTPNFHDFLNLPVKYNPDKYVYPLISSSYANTKVQGNINKYHNHKNFAITTYKPTVSPTYYTIKTPYFNPDNDKGFHEATPPTTISTTTTTTTTRPTTTRKPIPDVVYVSTKPPNLMDSAMNYPSIPSYANFEDFTTQRPKATEIYFTTANPNDVYLTTKRFSIPTTTKRTLSLFEQLFGEYDEVPTTETIAKPPSLFQNLPNNRNKDKYEPDQETPSNHKPEQSGIPSDNVLTGTAMENENAYEYEDDYGNVASESETNTVYQTKPIKFEIKSTIPSTSFSTTTKARTTTTTPATATTTTRTTTTKTTTTNAPQPDVDPYIPDNAEYDLETEEEDSYEPEYNIRNPSTTEIVTSTKVTSLPLGENHFGTPNLHPPIIAVTHNLKEQLNNEKVILKPFSQQPIASSSNIRIPSNQDTVSFVVGNQQNVGGGFIGTSFKEGPFDNSPFRPLIIEANGDKDTVSYTVQAKPEFMKPDFMKPNFMKPVFSQNFPESHQVPQKKPEVGGSSISIQPIKTSEASLSIGVPITGVKKVPGQVVDENLDSEKIEFPKKGIGAKIVFPEEKEDKSSTFSPDLVPPPKQPMPPNREVLQLNSKPMYHQLPSDLTPPSEQDIPIHLERPRPPWDPRPGHFYNGRPEYSRPPRPQPKPGPPEIYKRIDNLPNILPQFRPNAKVSSGPHYFDHMGFMKHGYMRQPLLERPSNRPVGFFEKLLPPPPPKNLHNLRKVPILEHDLKLRNIPEDMKKQEQYEFYQHQTPPQPMLPNRNIPEDMKKQEQYEFYQHQTPPQPMLPNRNIPEDMKKQEQYEYYQHQTPPQPMLSNRNIPEDMKKQEQYEFYQHETPPQVILSNRRQSDEPTIETLQMIQAKQGEKVEVIKSGPISTFNTNLKGKDTTEKPLYVVYPVNSAPIKLDALDSNKKEAVVVGTRAELPLPPSKINQEFTYESPKDRNDSPILKPHSKPATFAIKSDFPYPLERPDISALSDTHIGNNLELKEDSKYAANNQWGAVQDTEPRIVTGSKINYKNPNQISVTLKTYTEKPIAIAYTPTEPYKKLENTEKYSMPNYASPVISEIRPGMLEKGGSEITVSAIMHTHSQADSRPQIINTNFPSKPSIETLNKYLENHKTDTGEVPTKLDFQAPFQASLHVDGMSQGWTVVRNSEKSKIDRSDQDVETTTLPVATTKEFDIENFKPQLFGGFKPIYSFPEDGSKKEERDVAEREERTT